MISNQATSIASEERTLLSQGKEVSLPAHEVDRRLKHSLAELQKAERNAVLWFAEVVRRKIYREMGFSSIYQYAELELGFSKSKTAQFLRLSESFHELPELRRSVASGDLSWTKAREVAKVATAETEGEWIAAARKTPRRALENRVAEVRRQARVGSSGREQVALEMVSEKGSSRAGSEEDGAGGGADAKRAVGAARVDRLATAAPVDLHMRLTAEQYARYQALMETLARGGDSDKAELLLAGLEQLALADREATKKRASKRKSRRGRTGGEESESVRVNLTDACAGKAYRGGEGEAGRTEKFTRVNSKSPYQVVVHQCPTCKTGTVTTPRGEQPVSPRELQTILCDSYRRASGGKNQASVPPRLRRAVLERDRYRCRSAGCGRTGFLAVHHLAPREAGGGNTLENLITLCSGCHRALHGHG